MRLGIFMLIGALFIGACSEDTVQIQDLRRPLMASWGNEIILPEYRDFEAKAAALSEASEMLCTSSSSTSVESARTAWWAARQPWKRMEVFKFGPFKEEPLRLGPKIDFWPVRTDTVDETLAGTATLSADLFGSTQRGFPVIEYLLYDETVSASLVAGSRACQYLMVATADLAAQAEMMRTAWDPDEGNYLAQLLDAGEIDGMFESRQFALSEVVNRMAFTVENIRADKLDRPSGALTGDSPQIDKAESYLSGRSLTDIRDNLDGIEVLYFGTDAPDSLGLDDHAKNLQRDFEADMRAQLAASRAALDRIDEPLTQTILDAPRRVADAIEALRGLQTLIQVDIINQLALVPLFNDTDGD